MSRSTLIELALVFLLLIPAQLAGGGRSPIAGGGMVFTFSYSREDLRIEEDENGYHQVGLAGLRREVRPAGPNDWGNPDLPRDGRLAVLAPFDAVEDIEITFLDPDTLQGRYLPRPIQPPAGTGRGPVGPNPDVYNSVNPYPSRAADPLFCGTLRGVRLFDFQINPISYIGARQELILYRTVTVRVARTTLGAAASMTIRERQRPGRRWSRQHKEVHWIRRNIVNPEDLDLLYLGALPEEMKLTENTDLSAFNPTEKPSTNGTPVELVIITSDETRLGAPVDGMTTAFDRLAQWKIQSGVPTVVRTLEWIRSNYGGVDTQEQVRNFIIDAYEKWSTDWVLLGGDTDIVPARRLIYGNRPNPPSDLYYAGLDGNMNANGNQWFGESTGELAQVDPYHDVWVARVPADDSTQAATFIDKLFDYALVPGEADSIPPALYYQHALLATGFVGSTTWGSDRNGYTTAEAIARGKLPSTTLVTRLYEFVDTHCVDTTTATCNITMVADSVFRDPWADGITEWETTEQMVDSLNGGAHDVGYAYVWHREHSNQYQLGGPSHSGGINCSDCVHRTTADFNETAALRLTNGPQTFAMVTSGSVSNGFDFSSISERLLMNPAGGAIAYLGKARETSQRSHYVAVDFFGEVFENDVTWFGQTASLTIDGQSSLGAEVTWNPMGDPTLPLWTGPPIEIDVAITPSYFYKLGVNAFEVEVTETSGGAPVEDALVCIQSDDVYASDFTESDGAQTFVLNLSTTDTLWVTVSCANVIPEKTSIAYSAVYEVGPVVGYDSHALSDATSTLSNHNGVVEAGERIRVEVEVRNVGDESAQNVDGLLSAYGPVLFDLHPSTDIVYIGEDNSHPAADADSGFAFPANWYGIRPEGVPSELASGSERGIFVWRDFTNHTEPSWNLVARGYSTMSLVPTHYTVFGSIVTEGCFTDPAASGLEGTDTFSVVNSDSLYMYWQVETNGSDSLSFAAVEECWITAVRDSVRFGTIGVSSTASDTFLIDISPTTPDGHELNLALYITGSSGELGLGEFRVPVAAPVLELHELDWSKEGNTYDVYPYVKNQGGGRADSVCAFLSVDAGTATITDALVSFGAIEAGERGYESSGDPFVLSTTDVENLLLEVTMRTYYANGDSLDTVASSVDLTRPAPAASLVLEPDFGSVRALWTNPNPAPSDLLGANIFRGTSADTSGFVRLNADPIVDTRLFDDRTASPDTVYYYAVRLQDASGNESIFSEVRSDSPSPTQQDGWPRRTDAGHAGSPTLVDLDGDDDLEIVMTGRQNVYIWTPDGDEYRDGDGDPTTDIPFISLTDGDPDSRGLVCAPAVADIDGGKDTEIIFTRWEDKLFVYGDDGSLKWSKTLDVDHVYGNVGPGQSSPAVGNLVGTADTLEVVIGSLDGVIYGWDGFGNDLIAEDGYFAGTNAAFLYQTPALADIDDDGLLEVIVGTGGGRVLAYDAEDVDPQDGEADLKWEYAPGGAAFSTTAIGVIDDTLRVVATIGQTLTGEIVVLRASDGMLTHRKTGLDIPSNAGNPTPPVLGDVDGDSELEIVVGGYSKDNFGNPADRLVRLYVWDPIPDDLATLQDSTRVSPLGENSVAGGAIVGDIDGDDKVEIAFGADNFGVFIWEYDDGDLVAQPGWPAMLDGEVFGHVAVGDVDTSDTDLELVVADRSGRVHLFGVDDLGVATPSVEWSQFGNSALNQWRHLGGGNFGPPQPAPSVLTGLSEAFPNPFNPSTHLRLTIGRRQPARIAVYDIAGRLVRTLLDATLEPGAYDITWDGRSEGGRHAASGIYFFRLDTEDKVVHQKAILVK